MRWLAERGGPIDRFNQAMLLQVPAALREDHLAGALQACSIITMRCGCGWRCGEGMRQTGPHSGARSGALPGIRGTARRLKVAPPGAVAANACLRRVDIAGLDDAARRA